MALSNLGRIKRGMDAPSVAYQRWELAAVDLCPT